MMIRDLVVVDQMKKRVIMIAMTAAPRLRSMTHLLVAPIANAIVSRRQKNEKVPHLVAVVVARARIPVGDHLENRLDDTRSHRESTERTRVHRYLVRKIAVMLETATVIKTEATATEAIVIEDVIATVFVIGTAIACGKKTDPVIARNPTIENAIVLVSAKNVKESVSAMLQTTTRLREVTGSDVAVLRRNASVVAKRAQVAVAMAMAMAA